MTELLRLSECLYVGLCKEVGTRERVRMRRDTSDIKEIVRNKAKPRSAFRKMNSGSRREGFRLSTSDMDTMLWRDNHKVICDISQSQNYDLTATTLILMECEQSPPGFALLRILTLTDCEYVRNSLDNIYISSTMYKENTCSIICPNASVHGPCASGRFGRKEYDIAMCFKCDFWPTSAFPWIRRCQKWPDVLLRHDIYTSGCHLVAKGSPRSPHEINEWRISFSQAEQKLVYAMNHAQFLVYALLKLFLKEVINQRVDENLLCSYFVKTVVFWEIQQNTIPLWNAQNILYCFWCCFKHIIYWVYRGECPNFFIPENNMFLGKIVGSSQRSLLKQLNCLYKQGLWCLLSSRSLRCYIIKALYNPYSAIAYFEDDLLSNVSFDQHLNLEIFHNDHVITQNLDENLRYLEIVEYAVKTLLSRYEMIFLQKFTSTIFQNTAFFLQDQMRDENKMMYIADKISCQMLKLCARFGVVSDILYIAIYYYRTCRYRKAISILETAKARLSKPFIMYNGCVNAECYIETSKEWSWSSKMRNAIAWHIRFPRYLCYIDELSLEHKICRKNGNFGLYIPPLIVLHMLSVMCYNHIDTTRRQCALNDMTVLLYSDMNVYVPMHIRDISYQILGICQEISGDHASALQSYEKSLQQYPHHNIQTATKIRIQQAVCRLR